MPDAALGLAQGAVPDTSALGKDADRTASLQDDPCGLEGKLVACASANRKGAERKQYVRLPGLVEELDLGDEPKRAPDAEPDDEGVQEAAMVGGEEKRPFRRNLARAQATKPEVDKAERLEKRARQPVGGRHHSSLPRDSVRPFDVHAPVANPSVPFRLQRAVGAGDRA